MRKTDSGVDIKAKAQAVGAVILGGAHGSLAVARSLGRRGAPVWFVTDDHPITKYSRFVTRSFDWVGPNHDGAAGWLVDFARQWNLNGWTLFAGGDDEVRLVARNHAVLGQVFRLTTAPWSLAQYACDKRLTHEHALKVGVRSPWSFYPSNRDEIAGRAFPFPVILKPAYRRGHNAFVKAKAWRVDDLQSLLARYDEAVAHVGAEAVVIQEFIPGAGDAQFSYAAVWDKGVPIASMVARRTRQYPIDFGLTSTFVETVEQAEVETAACRFLAALRFSGLVEVEFKYDCRDQRYKLLDVNPRPWTWIGLGEAAGVDLPWIQWRVSQGEPTPIARGQIDFAWTHASRDLVSAAQRFFRGELRPRDYAASLMRPVRFAAFAPDDPMPAVVDLPVLAARMIKRRFAKPALSSPAPEPQTPPAGEGVIAFPASEERLASRRAVSGMKTTNKNKTSA